MGLYIPFDIITPLLDVLWLLPIVGMAFGGGSQIGSSESRSSGYSRGMSESQSQFGSESVGASGGTSRSLSLADAISQGLSRGFGFSGLQPHVSARLGEAIEPVAGVLVPQAAQGLMGARLNLPTLGPTGLFPQQEALAQEMVRHGIGVISGDMAGRGFVSPFNVPAIAGSAVQQALPQMAQLTTQNILAAAQAPMTEALQRSQGLQSLLSSIPSLLGGQQASLSEQLAQSQQRAASAADQWSEQLARSFGESLAKAMSEAQQESWSSGQSSGWNLGMKFA